MLAPCTLAFGEAVGDVQPLAKAHVGSMTLVGEGPGEDSGGGVERAGDAAMVIAAAGMASAAIPNLCKFTSFLPHVIREAERSARYW